MRNISFALTTEQVRSKQKTVTRRIGWTFLKPGTLLQPVEKCQGLKKGEKVTKIGRPIRVSYVTRERLDSLLDGSIESTADVVDEGFGHLSEEEFVEMFCRTHGCATSAVVTRIQFEYVEEA